MRIVAIDLPKGIIRHQYQSTNQWACVTCLGSHCQFVPIRWPSPEVFDEQIGSLSRCWRVRAAGRQGSLEECSVCLCAAAGTCLPFTVPERILYGPSVFLIYIQVFIMLY